MIFFTIIISEFNDYFLTTHANLQFANSQILRFNHDSILMKFLVSIIFIITFFITHHLSNQFFIKFIFFIQRFKQQAIFLTILTSRQSHFYLFSTFCYLKSNLPNFEIPWFSINSTTNNLINTHLIYKLIQQVHFNRNQKDEVFDSSF